MSFGLELQACERGLCEAVINDPVADSNNSLVCPNTIPSSVRLDKAESLSEDKRAEKLSMG